MARMPANPDAHTTPITVTGATLVGHALLHGSAIHEGVRVQRIEHRCWTVELPGHPVRHGLLARSAAAVVDAWLSR